MVLAKGQKLYNTFIFYVVNCGNAVAAERFMCMFTPLSMAAVVFVVVEH